MVGDAAVHVLDPGEAGFCPTVFLQGLKERKAALEWGGDRPPRTRAHAADQSLQSRQAPWSLVFAEAEGRVILGVQRPAARLEGPATEGFVPVGCALSSPSGVSREEASLCPSGDRRVADSHTVGTEGGTGGVCGLGSGTCHIPGFPMETRSLGQGWVGHGCLPFV